MPVSEELWSVPFFNSGVAFSAVGGGRRRLDGGSGEDAEDGVVVVGEKKPRVTHAEAIWNTTCVQPKRREVLVSVKVGFLFRG